LYLRENSAQFDISDVFFVITISSPKREIKKKDEEHDKEDEENPTNIGPGVTEWYDE